MSYITVYTEPIPFEKYGENETAIRMLEIFDLQYDIAFGGGKIPVHLCSKSPDEVSVLKKIEVSMTEEESKAWVEDTFLKDFVLKKLNAIEIKEEQPL